MNESDIVEVINLLRHALKTKDWDGVIDARNYLEEFVEDDSDIDDNY